MKNEQSEAHIQSLTHTHIMDTTKMWIRFAVSEIVKDNVKDLLTFHKYI